MLIKIRGEKRDLTFRPLVRLSMGTRRRDGVGPAIGEQPPGRVGAARLPLCPAAVWRRAPRGGSDARNVSARLAASGTPSRPSGGTGLVVPHRCQSVA